MSIMRVLLTGATGFVGRHLYPSLVEAGHTVVSTSRNPERAAEEFPGREWRYLEATDMVSLRNAMQGCDAAIYLIHGLAGGVDYPKREEQAARLFVRAAEDTGLTRIVYLGGMAPQGEPSNHLASRLRTGALIRHGSVPAIELRASMIVGHGGASWQICRDLAIRLPLMVLPRWLRSKTQPIAISDVVFALTEALVLDESYAGDYDIPGPETMSIRGILQRIARLEGIRPVMIGIPLLTPHLSTYWIRLVTRTDPNIVKELVEGLQSDILARDDRIWSLLPAHEIMKFDAAAQLALDAEAGTTPRLTRAVERGIRMSARKIAAQAPRGE